MTRQLAFGVLGPVEARVDGRLVPLPARSARLILALLLLERGRAVSSDALIDALWPTDPPKSARNAVQVHVWQLRKSLGPYGDVITTGAAGYAIVLELELDLDRFERLAAEGERSLAAGDAEAGAERLRDALELWRGPALADLAYEVSLQAPIQRLEELRLHARERRIDAELALGRHRALVPELDELVAAHPLHERLGAQLMLALYRSARQADALAAFRATRATFRQELGLEPSPALRRLEQAILVQDPALELAPAVAADVPSLPDRSLLIALEGEPAPETLELARGLATQPPRELIIAGAVSTDAELGLVTGVLNRQRDSLRAEGVAARAAAFVSDDPGGDLVRLAQRIDVDLLLVDGKPQEIAEGALPRKLAVLAEAAPCDVAILFGRGSPLRPEAVLVPFGAERHDWAALETATWIARGTSRPLLLAGSRRRRGRRDASRVLADASLAVQRALGVTVEPILINPGADALVAAAERAALIVAGFPDDWHARGLGPTRTSLAQDAPVPVLLVRAGVRPGGLAPRESLTRYTWSLDPKAPDTA